MECHNFGKVVGLDQPLVGVIPTNLEKSYVLIPISSSILIIISFVEWPMIATAWLPSSVSRLFMLIGLFKALLMLNLNVPIIEWWWLEPYLLLIVMKMRTHCPIISHQVPSLKCIIWDP